MCGEWQAMMETIRKAANSLVVKIIFAIIILCFIFTGVGFLGFGGSSNTSNDEKLYIAKVDGEGISRAAFEAKVQHETTNSIGDPSFTKMIRRNILAQQIDNYLAYKFSDNIHATISNELVKNYIKQQKSFFTNGKFDNDKYLKLLAENGYTPDSYAEIIRTALQQQQVIDALIQTSFVLPSDSEIALLENQTRDIYATLIDSSIDDMNDINITEEDEKKYYDEHKKEFFRKERVKLKYIFNSRDTIAESIKSIKVNEDEIKKEYEKNITKYSYPPKKAFSVIFVADKPQAIKIIKELSSGISFSDIAKNLNSSTDISLNNYGNNGSLGWFADDDSLPDFLKNAKLKKVNQISSPIPIDGGFLIVKLDDKQPAKIKDYNYVKIQIENELIKQKIQEGFNAVEEKIKIALTKSPTSIDELAENTGLELRTTDWTTYKDPYTIMHNPEISDLVFSEEMIADEQLTHKISEMIPIERNYGSYDFVIQVIDYRPDGIAPFDEVKETINKKLSRDIADNRFKATIDNLLTQLKTTDDSDKINFSQRYELKRNSTNLDKEVIDMVFDLEQPIKGTRSTSYGAKFLENNTAYIVALTKVNTPTEYKDISSELLPLIINNTYYYFSDDIRSKSKIEIMPDANM